MNEGKALQKTKLERFDTKQEIDRSWMVFDIFTGMPVTFAGRAMHGLGEQVARELVGMLNAQDMLRRASLGF
ncbi:hypothetical protein CPY51_27470 [Rhizobium tubonense]|uniref:Uncharacterized protein n=1 Tax=Rhizobium tubonense TaxID=484088 RepID=A0A2W4CCI4_9HYPH|nr:hypothetical protein CPY51_27470 [Rhizobium tubonense]